jgi:hypothetical protein
MLRLPKLNTCPVKLSLTQTNLQRAKGSEASGCHAIPACALGTVVGAETSPVQGGAMSDVLSRENDSALHTVQYTRPMQPEASLVF